jgi:hyaluronoglucosaminidase
MHFVLVALFLALSGVCQSHAFEIAWNSPWPTACKAKVEADAITKYGIRTNAGNAFNGEIITTFYNNPGRMTLGRWPCYAKNGTALNGGLPQLGNLTAHLAQVRLDVARLLPEQFDGFAVIDWEVWKPWLDIGDTTIYFNKSLELARGNAANAIAAFNSSSLEFMVRTLEVAREVRPKGRWGYFGVVGCTFDVITEMCSPEFQRHNDALKTLWSAGSALYPELYATCPFRTTAKEPTCNAKAKITKKIAARLREAKRVVSLLPPPANTIPVIAFTWFVLDDGVCTGPEGGKPGHCPLMRNKTDLHAEFELAKAAGAQGMVVWGSSGDVQDAVQCAAVGDYVANTLGPLLQRISPR